MSFHAIIFGSHAVSASQTGAKTDFNAKVIRVIYFGVTGKVTGD